MPILLSLSDFSVERGEHFKLRQVNWEVQSGEHWCILGPNGCGKTSVLSSITGYAPPTSGRIEMFGEIYGESEWQEIRKSVGVVSTGLLPYIEDSEIVEELVITGKHAWLTNWGSIARKDRATARQLLKKMGCPHINRCQWRTLSQGERQRVLIARTLMAKVKLLILDEPCSGLDPVARASFLNSINDLASKKSSPSQIMVTHHVEEIIPNCTHVLLIGRTGVVAQGPKKKVLRSPLLSEAYQHPVKISQRNGHYQLTIR